MRWPIRNQIFFPFAGLLAVSVLLVAAVAAWKAAEQSRLQKLNHMNSVASALGEANFPLTQDVSERIAAMIGGEVIVADPRGRVTASTIPLESLPTELKEYATISDRVTGDVTLNGMNYFVTVIPRFRVSRPGPLFVLLPQEDLNSLRTNAITPPLLIAVPTVIVALGLALLIARGMACRVDRLRHLFSELSNGNYRTVDVTGVNDELRDLLCSANDLSARLDQLQLELKRTERLDLLGQLSGGLAHQLRNSITGAKMAVQLHHQSCPSDDNDMLQTAISQLRLTEEQVLAVLSLRDGVTVNNSVDTVNLCTLVEDVQQLLKPQSSHWKTRLEFARPADDVHTRLKSAASLKGAILNLVLNSVEASGIEGNVRIDVVPDGTDVAIAITDSGPGFSFDTTDIGEAFLTTKPEGIGLGLTIAQHAVMQEGGSLKIERNDGHTIVTISLPGVVSPLNSGVLV